MRTIKMEDIDLEEIKKDQLESLLQNLKGREEIYVNGEGHWYEDEEAEEFGIPWRMERYIKKHTSNEGKQND